MEWRRGDQRAQREERLTGRAQSCLLPHPRLVGSLRSGAAFGSRLELATCDVEGLTTRGVRGAEIERRRGGG